MPLYFIAITAPPEIDEQVLEYKQYMLDKFGCKVALKSPAHITLVPPFTLPDSERETLQHALKDFTSGCTDFTVELRNFAAFPPRVLYVDVTGNKPLQQLQAALEESLLRLAFPVKKSTRPFHPHVTVANRDLDKQYFQQAWSHFKDQLFRADFPASGISLLKHNGSRWTTVYTASFT